MNNLIPQKMKSPLLYFMLFIGQLLFAQKPKFHVNTGFLLSQIDGDNIGGFKKIGYSFGGGFRFEKEMTFLDWSTRINQKGMRETNQNTFVYALVRLNYLESDLIYSFKIGEKVFLGGGFYSAFLLQKLNTLRRLDFAPSFRLDYRPTEKINIQPRFSMSVLSIRQKNYSYWLNRAIMLELSYDL
jgi:hypothetical protein